MPRFCACSNGSSLLIWQELCTLRQQYADLDAERVWNSLTPSGAHAALSAYTAQQQTYIHTLMLESEAVRPSAHIWSGLALVQISPNQTPRTLFHTSIPSLPLPLQYAWPRHLCSFHPHSHGNSFSLAWGKRQPKVQLAGFTLEILFITLAATLISPSVVLPLSLSGGSLLNIFPVLKFMDFSSMRTYIPFPTIVTCPASPQGNCLPECQEYYFQGQIKAQACCVTKLTWLGFSWMSPYDCTAVKTQISFKALKRKRGEK